MSDPRHEELRTKRRALHETRLQMARYGINAPVNLIMDEEDLAREVRAIERELGIDQTPTIQERRQSAPARPRYEAPPEPEPVFQQRMVGQENKMKQADIEHQMSLLSIHRRNLGHLRAQMRELGAYAPPYVRSGVGEQQEKIVRIKGILRDMGQTVQDLPGDE